MKKDDDGNNSPPTIPGLPAPNSEGYGKEIIDSPGNPITGSRAKHSVTVQGTVSGSVADVAKAMQSSAAVPFANEAERKAFASIVDDSGIRRLGNDPVFTAMYEARLVATMDAATADDKFFDFGPEDGGLHKLNPRTGKWEPCERPRDEYISGSTRRVRIGS